MAVGDEIAIGDHERGKTLVVRPQAIGETDDEEPGARLSSSSTASPAS